MKHPTPDPEHRFFGHFFRLSLPLLLFALLQSTSEALFTLDDGLVEFNVRVIPACTWYVVRDGAAVTAAVSDTKDGIRRDQS